MTGSADVILGPDGRIYVLDSRLNNLRVFTLDGTLVGTWDRSGRGPGEFYAAESLALDPLSNRIYVGDMIRELDVFVSEAEGRLKYLHSLKLPRLDPETLCASSGSIVLIDENPGQQGAIHLLNEQGELQKSFGTIYSSPNPAVNTALADAIAICHPAKPLLLIALTKIGEIKAYSLAGDLLWIASYPEFLTAPYTYEEDVMVSTELPDVGYRIDSLTLATMEFALVQITHWRRQGERMQKTKTESYVLSAITGRVGYVGYDLPLIVAASGNEFVTVEDDIEARLSVYQIQ